MDSKYLKMIGEEEAALIKQTEKLHRDDLNLLGGLLDIFIDGFDTE